MLIESHPIFKAVSTAGTNPQRFVFSTENDSKILVVQENSLKWCFQDSEEYQYTEFNAIENYDHATLNDSGTLLCIYSDRCIQVVALTWNSTKPAVYNISPPTSIKQVVWHPRGKLDSTIVVLGGNDTIFMHELHSENFFVPSVVLNNPSKQLGISSNVRDITSICFSSDGLTLYLLNTSDGGDVYSLYPCLPSEFSISPQLLTLSFHKALLQYERLKAEDTSAVKRNVIKQLQLISKLHKQYTEEHILPVDGQLTFSISANYYDSGFQGPFTINPFPEELYSVTARQIEAVRIGDLTNELLLISFDNGTVLKCFPDLEPSMSWEKQEYSHNNSLIIIDSMRAPGSLVPLSNGKYVVLGPNQAIFINCDRLAAALKQSLAECDLSELASTNIDSSITKIDGSFDCAATWKIGGILQLILVSRNEICHLSIPLKLIKTSIASKPIAKPEPKFKVKFSRPSNEIDAMNRKVQLACKNPFETIIPPQQRKRQLKNDSNEEQLSTLTELSKEVMNRIIISQTFGLTLHDRLLEQQCELTRQLATSGEILKKKENISGLYTSQKSRWDQALKREENIDSRLSSLREKLSQVAQSKELQRLPISNAENDWFKEIRSQVSLFNKSVLEQQDIRENLSLLRSELDTANLEKNENTKQDAFSWSELQRILETDSEIIKKCNTELKNTVKELEEGV